jgi:hypothetical protein
MNAPEENTLDALAEEKLGVRLVRQLVSTDAEEFEVVVVIL